MGPRLVVRNPSMVLPWNTVMAMSGLGTFLQPQIESWAARIGTSVTMQKQGMG